LTLASGQIIHNRYRIARLVGQGGFGAVYRAWDMALEQPVALKENTSGGGDTQRQFEREAKLLAGLRHPNLPRVIDHFILPGQGQYLVMDFVEGKSLGALLRERNLPFEEADAVKWVRQVSEALTYLHTRTPPIIHRDIKPDNIILTDDGRAMLVDFGISKIFDESKGTTTGAQAVTHGYSPLEQYGRGKTDARSDIYSLGATLYTLLTGLVPPDAPDLVNGLETLRPPRQANPALRESTSAAIMAAMAPSISQRINSAAGFEQLLAVKSPPAARGTVIAPMTMEATYMASASAAPPSRPDSVPPPAARTISAPIVAPDPAPDGPAAKTAPGKPLYWALLAVALLVMVIGWQLIGLGGNGVEPTPVDMRAVSRGGVQVEQVFVPAGSFMMGSENGADDEQPVHEVTLDAFWIDRTEVTNAQFAGCVADGACQPPSDTSSYTRDNYYGNDEFGDYPVINVSWIDASEFCEWAGGRLPTEAEWEYAARGPESFTYPWDYTQPSDGLLNFNTNVGDTSEVGSYPDGASWVGALDMAGNVWEWVNDWYDSGYYQNSPGENPTGPASGEYRVLRGGAWNNDVILARSSVRLNNLPPSGQPQQRRRLPVCPGVILPLF
jgi:formylglycine-generating enzyme required for sulfatase activity